MKNLIKNPKLLKLINTLRPWIVMIAVVLTLRYTGLLAGISAVAQSALVSSGVLDINIAEEKEGQKFDYEFTVKDLNGKEVDMSSFRGKVIFLNLWATWCGPCRAEMPSIQALYNKVDRDKIAFVMLSLDRDDHHARIVKYVADQNFSFPVYQPLSAVPNQLRVSIIPTTFVVGTDGKIKLKHSGTANYNTDEFQKFLEGLAQESATN